MKAKVISFSFPYFVQSAIIKKNNVNVLDALIVAHVMKDYGS